MSNSTTNQEFLKLATEVLNALQVRYIEADLDTQLELHESLDQAMIQFSRARLALLKQNLVCTSADVAKMQQMRTKLAKSVSFRQVLDTATGFVGFLVKRFL